MMLFFESTAERSVVDLVLLPSFSGDDINTGWHSDTYNNVSIVQYIFDAIII